MKYVICCLLKGDVEQYHHTLRDEIAEEFNLQVTKKQDLPTHFKLKYNFETDKIEEVEQGPETVNEENNLSERELSNE